MPQTGGMHRPGEACFLWALKLSMLDDKGEKQLWKIKDANKRTGNKFSLKKMITKFACKKQAG